MAESLLFQTRDAFRAWLAENCRSASGVWLLFGKPGGPQTLSASEALEEALCFGWIDGQIRRVDDQSYVKYFARRGTGTEWSAKNIALAEKLEAGGRMTADGREKIEEAKQNGRFQPKERPVIGAEQIQTLTDRLQGHEPALTNYLAMSPSVQRNYAGLYHDCKTTQTQEKRLERIIARLNDNLKPM